MDIDGPIIHEARLGMRHKHGFGVLSTPIHLATHSYLGELPPPQFLVIAFSPQLFGKTASYVYI
jgi:hypothetical protein